VNENSNIWIEKYSNVINTSPYYKLGATVPYRKVGVEEGYYKVAEDDYMVGVMALMFFIIAIIYFCHSVRLNYRIKDFFTSKRLFSGDIRTDNAMESLNVFLLTLISAMSLSIIYFDDIITKSHLPIGSSRQYILYVAGIGLILLFIYTKIWIYALVNWVFFDPEQNKKWTKGYLLLTTLTAFLFYPLALIDIYAKINSNIVISCTLLIVLLYECLLFYKQIINFKVKKYGYLLNILYFCSVELLPLLLMWHLAVWLSDSFIVKNLLY